MPELADSKLLTPRARERAYVEVQRRALSIDVVAANAAARKRGIAPGLSIAAALALGPEIAIHLRDERAESHALKGIALWAGQWTSTISIEPPACVLLEISGGLAYFGGLEKLLTRIDSGLATLGVEGVRAFNERRKDLVEGGFVIAGGPDTVRERARSCQEIVSAFAFISAANLQKVGGVQALMISHASRPTLRKRCGSFPAAFLLQYSINSRLRAWETSTIASSSL